MKKATGYFFILYAVMSFTLYSQNEGKKWYFGNQAALDFMTSPPTVLLNSMMNCPEGSASIADAAGNLLFYTDGVTIYNHLHLPMTGGTFMAGTNNACESSVIVKQPGSTTIYYVFLLQGNGGGLYYSIVDMSLSSGLGATTATNVIINPVNSEKLSATKHCNGTDVWIVTHSWPGDHFLSFLLTSSGLSTPVVSAVGTNQGGVNSILGNLKISPTGKKIGLGIWTLFNTFELYDFDNTTGIVSNPLILGGTFAFAYGCDFSPDGSKFYGSCEVNTGVSIYQWDLCAGNGTAVIASQYTVAAGISTAVRNGLQVGPDGKIYVARNGKTSLGVINSPNSAGGACNYVDVGQSLGTGINTRGLPNFVSSLFKPPHAPITYSTNMLVACTTTSFNSASTTSVQIGCGVTGYSLTGFQWKFGDPSSGSANTSFLTNPIHVYPAPGTYTAQLILNYSCGGGTDTLSKVVVILTPTLSVSMPAASCGGQTSATVTTTGGSGNYSYTWTPSGLTTSVISNVALGTYTVNMLDTTSGCFSSLVTTITSPGNSNPVVSAASISICPTATTVLSASGATSYTWNPGNFVGNNYVVNPYANTVYTVIGLASSCTAAATASVSMLGGFSPTITSSVLGCVGHVLQLNAGGANSYTWNTPGGGALLTPTVIINSASINNAGTYTLNMQALNNCTAALTATVVIFPSPTLAAAGQTVCVSQTLNLSSSSSPASDYYWTGPNSYTSSLQNLIFVNPTTVISGIYTVLTTNTLLCTNTATVQALVLPIPNPSIVCSSTLCSNNILQFFGSGGTIYNWTGPNSYTSSVQNPSIFPISPLQSGSYTLTASNGYCSANSVKTITVLPSPTLAMVSNAPICETQSLSLQVNTGSTAVSYTWYGPYGFSDTLKYTGRDSSRVTYSGIYTVIVRAANSCETTGVDSITIFPLPALVVSGATVCLNEKAVLKASGGSSYNWTGPGFFSSSLASPVITNATNISPNQYTVLASSANNCTAIAYANVVTWPLPIPSLTASAKRLCANSTLYLQGGGGVFYKWEGAGNLIYIEKDVNFVVFNPGTIQIYSLTVTDANNCKSITSTSVQVDPVPFGNLVKSSNNTCVPFCTEYKFVSGGPNPITNYSWNLNNETSPGPSFKHCFNEGGIFTLNGVFTDSNNCKASIDFIVNALPKPKADFDYSPLFPIENTEPVFFTNTSGGEGLKEYNWFFSDNEHKTSDKNSHYFYSESGNYPVALVVTNNWGCADSIVKNIHVEADFHLYVPNTFTPNNDDLNEIFLPIGRGIKTYYLSVFNRWGIQVFESSELQTGWDGSFRGEECEIDTYQWKINISSESGESKELKGYVNLIR